MHGNMHDMHTLIESPMKNEDIQRVCYEDHQI